MSGRRLYIGRLGPDVQRADLEGFFSPLGRIVDIRVMGGFAFLEYEELKDAEAAVADLNGRDFMGDRIMVEFAKPPRPREQRFEAPRYGDRGGYGGGAGGYGGGGGGGGGYGAPPPSRGPPPPRGFRLVVKGVPDGVSWQDLKDFGRTAGNVGFADVDRNSGEGFIEYGSRSDADEAIRVLSNTQFNGATVTLEDAPSGGRGGGGGGGGYDRPPAPRYDDRRDDRGHGGSSRGGDRYDDRDRRDPPPPRDDHRRRSVSPAARRDRSPEPRRERDERSPPAARGGEERY